MNDDQFGDLHAWIEPELEARIAALVLGEASAFETDELERLMGERPELRLYKRRLEKVHGLLREAVKPGDDGEWRLSGERRAELFEKIGMEVDAEDEVVVLSVGAGDRETRIRRQGLRVAMMAAACLLISLLLAPFFMTAGMKGKRGGVIELMEADLETKGEEHNLLGELVPTVGRLFTTEEAAPNADLAYYSLSVAGGVDAEQPGKRESRTRSALDSLRTSLGAAEVSDPAASPEPAGEPRSERYGVVVENGREAAPPVTPAPVAKRVAPAKGPEVENAPALADADTERLGEDQSKLFRTTRGAETQEKGKESDFFARESAREELAEGQTWARPLAVVDGREKGGAFGLDDLAALSGEVAANETRYRTYTGVDVDEDGVSSERLAKGLDAGVVAEQGQGYGAGGTWDGRRDFEARMDDIIFTDPEGERDERIDGRRNASWAGGAKDQRGEGHTILPEFVEVTQNNQEELDFNWIADAAKALEGQPEAVEFDGFIDHGAAVAWNVTAGKATISSGARFAVPTDPGTNTSEVAARVEVVREFIYPGEYEPPEVANGVLPERATRGIALGAEFDVSGVATAGLRSGDAAVTRNSIDAILNNRDENGAVATRGDLGNKSDASSWFYAGGDLRNQEGEKRGVVRDLDIAGNAQTEDRVTRRELPARPGDLFGEVELEKDWKQGQDQPGAAGLEVEHQRKPAAPSSAMAKVIGSTTPSPTAAPVPEVNVPDPTADFGSGDDFGDGWGSGGSGGGGGFAGQVLTDERTGGWKQDLSEVSGRASGSGPVSGGAGEISQVEAIRRQALTQESEARLMEGRDAYAQGEFEDAVTKYRVALDQLPGGEATEDRRRAITAHLADGSVALAQQYRRTGKYEEARELLESTLLVDPENEVARQNLEYLDDPIRTSPALTYEHQEKVDQVRRELYTGEGLYNLGRYDAAMEEFEAVIEKDPYNTAARRWMERISSAKSDYYRAAYDETRARMLAEVDEAWELSVPPTNGPESAELVELKVLEEQEKSLERIVEHFENPGENESLRRKAAMETDDYKELSQKRESVLEEAAVMEQQAAAETDRETKDNLEAKARSLAAYTEKLETELEDLADRAPESGVSSMASAIPLQKEQVEQELAKIRGKKKALEGRKGGEVDDLLATLDGLEVGEQIVKVEEQLAQLSLASKGRRDNAVDRALESHDYVESKREYENAQGMLQALKLQKGESGQVTEEVRSSPEAALEVQIRAQEDLVEEKRKVLDTIVQAIGIPYVEGVAGSGEGRSEEVLYELAERQLYEQEAERDQLENQVKTLAKLDSEELMKYAAGLNLPQNGVTKLYEEFIESERELVNLQGSGLGEEHPNVAMLKLNNAEKRKDLDRAVASLREILKTQMELVDGRLERMRKVRGGGDVSREVEALEALKLKLEAQRKAEAEKAEAEKAAALKEMEKSAAEEPFSTFSLHVSDVSFKLAQAALADGTWPEADRVRVEEFVNAFDYGDPTPVQEEKVACRMEQAAHPFMQQRNVMRVAMSTAAVGRAEGVPLRLTILLDNSGSMERADRAQSVKNAFALLVAQLNPQDEVTLIGFARTPRLLQDGVSGDKAQELLRVLAETPSEGGTNLEEALLLGLEKAVEHRLEGAQNRIILLTDGAANLGDAKPERLARLVERMRERGIAFDACGVGADGLNDDILEALTRKGDGRYYFLDRPEDADAGFAKQIAGALRPAAKNVKVQVEFNPKRVGHYALYGFEKHELKKEDFRNDSVDAAELAAEEAGVALYHFETLPNGEGDVGTVSVRFQDMATGEMVEKLWPIPYVSNPAPLEEAEPSMKLAATAALLGEALKGSAIGDLVEMGTLDRVSRSLQTVYPHNERVGQLIEMIGKVREMGGGR